MFVDVFMMCLGVAFQEFGERRTGFAIISKIDKAGSLLRASWLVVCTLLTWSYLGNLKASLVRKDYEKATQTLDEVVDRDLRLFMSVTFLNYLNATSQLSQLNSRLACQTMKANELYEPS